MRKLLSCVVLGLMMSAVVGAGGALGEYYDDNSGDSWEDAYIIDSAEDFELMLSYDDTRLSIGKYYKIGSDFTVIVRDIDYSTGSVYGHFYGYLDGQNHTITIDIADTSQNNASLFGAVSVNDNEVAIKNLNVKGSVTSNGNASALALMLSNGIIENCNVDANIEASNSAGGIVWLNSGTIRNCTFNGNVSSLLGGGIASMVVNGRIENCTVSSGSVISAKGSAPSVLGGIAGQMMSGNSQSAAIINCTSEATLESSASLSFIGGIAGQTNNAGSQYTGMPLSILSDNTWPSEYPEVGDLSSPDLPSIPTPDIPSQQEYTELPPATIQPIELTQESLDQIADLLSLDSELYLLDNTNISSPQEPTQAMRDFAANDEAELIGKLNTLNVEDDGYYVFKVNLGDRLWGLLESQDISSYKIYALNDSEASDTEVSSAFINGLLSTVEILTMSGQRMEKFGVREFLMVGFLKSGVPLSMYVAKVILALLTGGLGACNAGYAGAISAIVLVWFIRRRRR